MGLKNNIPNAVTSLNLVCGCISIHFAYQGQLEWSGLAIFVAAIFDFADGFVARLLHVKSEMGKQLDSLADVVSFGVAPGIIMFHLLQTGDKAWGTALPAWVPAIAIVLPVFSAWRLAKFNIDTRQSDSFIGLPTPAMGLVIAALPILIYRNLESPLFPFNDYVVYFVLHPAVLISTTLVFAWLMVSPLPLFAMKFSSWGWQQNKLRYIFLIVSFLLLLLFFFTAIPIIIIFYILLSITVMLFKKKNSSHDEV